MVYFTRIHMIIIYHFVAGVQIRLQADLFNRKWGSSAHTVAYYYYYSDMVEILLIRSQKSRLSTCAVSQLTWVRDIIYFFNSSRKNFIPLKNRLGD